MCRKDVLLGCIMGNVGSRAFGDLHIRVMDIPTSAALVLAIDIFSFDPPPKVT